MTVKEFYSIEEIEKYYDKETNTYVFEEDIVLNFDLNVDADIDAMNIRAYNIDAYNIDAYNINAGDIEAWNISARDVSACDIEAWNISACNISADNINYYAVCFAYNNIFCKSIKGRRKNAKHFVLDGKLEVEE